MRECAQCEKPYYFYPSKRSKFCSYRCHLDSGGAHRAGLASNKMRHFYGIKKDANHQLIIDALKKLGAGVIDISRMGNGMPDLIVWCRNAVHLVEVKNPKTSYGRRNGNALQRAWAADWRGGPIFIVRNVDDVITLIRGDLASLKRI